MKIGLLDSSDRRSVIGRKTRVGSVLFFLFLSLSAVSARALEFPEPSFMAGSGVLVDIAPFGVEQLYPSFSVGVGTSGSFALWFRPSFAINQDSWMLRLPLFLSLDLLSFHLSETCFDRLRLAVYGGGGLEIYRSEYHDTESPLLVAGCSLFFGPVYLDAAASRVYRYYNDDSDLTLSAGVLVEF